ncbi:CbiX/SirB N-terminal domain-containing protein [Antarcticimicrobium sediminis]|uniref:Cobalamin biosynthesis protein CbiX n=1 Tax=Antarcticimicrobium sediminis TaxID=2546227 RepID=A0A4R5F0J5_9RHOB|nr:CbiX/SirB N-terminal domain-containing protein [Antarcticimicrobium sediminis]TDE40995.1 cobalamin biosynthesis protein CbiX [Antarcticimicrobium sediminis]
MADDTPLNAILVAHGQPSEPAPAEAALAALAAQVQVLAQASVGAATLAAPGALEAALERLAPEGVIYPFFMADGFFVRKTLLARLGGHPARVLPPLGRDPGLPVLAAAHLATECAARGWGAAQVSLLIAAHGSARGPRAAAAARDFGTALAALWSGAAPGFGFVEEAPFLADAARGLPQRSLCLPFFAAAGGHYREDVPQALASAAFPGALLPPLGQHRDVPALIARALVG